MSARDELSPSVRRVIELPRPAWRGRMHLWMVPVALLGAIYLQVVAESGNARLVAAAYGFAAVALYAASAAAHYKVWEPSTLHKLFNLDQSMIMVHIAASSAVVAYAFGDMGGWAFFAGTAVMTSIGITAIWLPFHPPRGMMNTLFLSLSWWPIFFIGRITDAIGMQGTVILLAGGLVLTVGALIVGFQKPDPNPQVFGYHEIWHVFVIIGTAIHFWLFVQILTGNAPL